MMFRVRSPIYRAALILTLLPFVAVMVSCRSGPVLRPAPYVMLGEEGRQYFKKVRPEFQTTDIPVVYFTNRADCRLSERGRLIYSNYRSDRIAFGVVKVSPETELSWDELVQVTTSQDRPRPIGLEVTSVQQAGEILPLRDRLQAVDGQLVYPPESSTALQQDLQDLERCIEPWLKTGNDNGVVIYVHGVFSPFEDAAIRLANTWHATARQGVPILFSWPTGREGFKPFNYARDQESGDFAVGDLKLLLTALAMNERIARVHIVAWSRGNELVIKAMRELHEEVLAANGVTLLSQIMRGQTGNELRESPANLRSTADVLKLESVLLVAADMDLEVFEQRVFSERVMHATRRLVVYSSPKDRALDIADLFFQSKGRLGQVTAEKLDPTIVALIADLPSLEIIECRVSSDSSHGYIFEHPGAMSDMIQIIRDGKPIGAEHGRPLKPLSDGFWLLDEDYLKPSRTN